MKQDAHSHLSAGGMVVQQWPQVPQQGEAMGLLMSPPIPGGSPWRLVLVVHDTMY